MCVTLIITDLTFLVRSCDENHENISFGQRTPTHPGRVTHIIMELRIRVNKNVEKGSDFGHQSSTTFLQIRG